MVTSKHVESIRGAVDELAHLEALAQSSFWSIRSRYCGAASVSEDVDMVGGRGDGSDTASGGRRRGQKTKKPNHGGRGTTKSARVAWQQQ